VVRVRALADTGALLAYLDKKDRWHRRCREAFASFHLPLVTSAAVLTELFHLVGDDARQVQVAWSFVRSGALTVAAVTDDGLSELEGLMRRYHDRPMDFADATLVLLAERHSLTTVFTVDHDDFETYRVGGRRRFRIVPSR
jgi:predicted nucleic acid-binding protein